MIPYCGDYKDILKMVHDACGDVFYDGPSDNTVVESATQIYIKQMELMAAAKPTDSYYDPQTHRVGNNIEEVKRA